MLGLSIAPITDEQRQAFNLPPEAEGLVVVNVAEDSDAFDKGMREGDVITEVGQSAVTSAREMRERIKSAEEAGRNSILLHVRRDGRRSSWR